MESVMAIAIIRLIGRGIRAYILTQGMNECNTERRRRNEAEAYTEFEYHGIINSEKVDVSDVEKLINGR